MDKLPSDKCNYDKSGSDPGPQRCEEPAQTITSYCVFHTPIEEAKPNFWPRFLEYYDKTVIEYRKAQEGMKEHVNLDCRGFVFPDIPEDVFTEVVPFNVNFSGARFEGSANFKNVIFERSVKFRGATFKGPSSFTRITMRGGDFSNATFEDTADFVSVQFEEGANFEDAQFHGNTLFKRIGIRERAVFIGALFKRDIKFQEIYTSAKITIDLTRPGEYGKYRFAEVWLANVDVENPKRLTFKSLDLGKWVLAETEAISEANFHDVSWAGGGKPKRNHTRDEYLAVRLESWTVEELSLYSHHEKAAEVYRRLRKNFENRLSFSEASDFHKGEMEMRRLGYERKGLVCLLNWNYLFLQGYRIFGGYGERIRNPILSFVGVGLVFAGLWSLLGFPILEGETVKISHNFGDAILFSFKTFLTLPGKAFCLVQELVGAFQRAAGVGIITLFILALRRAFRR